MSVYIGRYTLTVEYAKGEFSDTPSVHRGSCAGVSLYAALKAAEHEAYTQFGYLAASSRPWNTSIKKLTLSVTKRDN